MLIPTSTGDSHPAKQGYGLGSRKHHTLIILITDTMYAGFTWLSTWHMLNNILYIYIYHCKKIRIFLTTNWLPELQMSEYVRRS